MENEVFDPSRGTPPPPTAAPVPTAEDSAEPAAAPVAPAPKNAQAAINLLARHLLAKMATAHADLGTDAWTQGQRNRLDRAAADLRTRLEKRIKPVE